MRASVFDIRTDTWPNSDTRQRDLAVSRIVHALDVCTFPWWRTIPALSRLGRFPFPIEFMDPADGAAGYVSRNRMWLKPVPTLQTIAHELAHVMDLCTLGQFFDDPSPWFNQNTSPWRDALLDLAVHHDGHDGTRHNWSPNALQDWPWQQRPIEAVTVPLTAAFFTDPACHFPDWQFRRAGHTWDDPQAVADIVLSRSIDVYADQNDIAGVHLPAVLEMAELGLVQGDADGRFNPKAPITREQHATVTVRLLDHLKDSR